MNVSRVLLVALVTAAVGCHSPMNMLVTASDSARRIAQLTWWMIMVATVVYGVVIVALLFAVRRNRSRAPELVDLSTPGESWIIAGGVVLPALVLAAVFFISLGAMGRESHERPALTIRVVGRQWWWHLDYHPGDPRRAFAGANEIHIPVGRPVQLLLTSADVIHSFWVPQLQGKLDVLPGDTNDLRLTASVAGVYYGKCAEFCGAQHTNMGITVVAQDSASFAQWEAAQRAVATASVDTTLAHGASLFTRGSCAGCHAVRGTSAAGVFGPDLTHVASRLTIGAGLLPMQRGSLDGWIANAPALKPGVLMPKLSGLTGLELQALSAYVASLR